MKKREKSIQKELDIAAIWVAVVVGTMHLIGVFILLATYFAT